MKEKTIEFRCEIYNRLNHWASIASGGNLTYAVKKFDDMVERGEKVRLVRETIVRKTKILQRVK